MSDVYTTEELFGHKDNIQSLLNISFKSPAVVSGIMGNIHQETGGSFDFKQKQIGGGKGEGLFQFTSKGFKDGYKRFLKELDFEDSAESQIGFMSNVLDTDEFHDIGAGNRAKVKKAFESGDVDTITEEFSKRVLRPGKPQLDKRKKFSKEVFDVLNIFKVKDAEPAGQDTFSTEELFEKQDKKIPVEETISTEELMGTLPNKPITPRPDEISSLPGGFPTREISPEEQKQDFDFSVKRMADRIATHATGLTPEQGEIGQKKLRKAISVPVSATLMGPLFTMGFEALNQAKNAIVSSVKKEKYSALDNRMLSELIPDDTNKIVKIGSHVTEVLADIALISAAGNLAKQGMLKDTLSTMGKKLSKAGYGEGKMTITKDAIKKVAKGTTLEQEASMWVRAKTLKVKPKGGAVVPKVALPVAPTVKPVAKPPAIKPPVTPAEDVMLKEIAGKVVGEAEVDPFAKDITGKSNKFKESTAGREDLGLKAIDKNRKIVHSAILETVPLEKTDKVKFEAKMKDAIILAKKYNNVLTVFEKEYGAYRQPFDIDSMKRKVVGGMRENQIEYSKSLSVLEDSPDTVKVYRGIKDKSAKDIVAGDFVSFDKEYAKEFGENIVELDIPKNDLRVVSGTKEMIYVPDKPVEPRTPEVKGDVGLVEEAKKYGSAKRFVNSKFNEWFNDLSTEEKTRIGNDTDARMAKFNEMTEELTPIWKSVQGDVKKVAKTTPTRTDKKKAMIKAGEFIFKKPVTYEGGTVWSGDSGLNTKQMLKRLEDIANVPARFKSDKDVVKNGEEASALLYELKMNDPAFKNYQSLYQKAHEAQPAKEIEVKSFIEKHGLSANIVDGAEGEYSGGRVTIGTDKTMGKAFSADWTGNNPDFISEKEYPRDLRTASHEVSHGLFSKNPEKGHKALAELQKLGVPKDQSFESLMDLSGLYLLEPYTIKNTEIRKIISEFAQPTKAIEKPKAVEKLSSEDIKRIDDTKINIKPSKGEIIDWGTGKERGQGKRSGGMVTGGMGDAPKGKKAYPNWYGNLPDYESIKGDVEILNDFERNRYLRARSADYGHDKAMEYAFQEPKAVEKVKKDVSFVKESLKEPIEKIGPQLKEKKGELRIAGEQKEASELEQAYAKQKDIWIGNKDVRTTLEIPAEKGNLQTAIKTAANTKDYGDLAKGYDMAIQLHIDSKRNPQQVTELYDKLSPEKKKLVDLSKNLPPEVQKVANEISESYKQIGLEALETDVIKNVLDNYAARIWDVEGQKGIEKFRKFGTTTRHAKQRVFDTIVEGWSKGFELKVKGSTNNLAILKEEIVKTIEDKKFVKTLKKIKDVDGNPLLTTKHIPGYTRVDHPNFKTWKHSGKAEPGEVYGKNSFVDDEGNLFERQEMYAPSKQANNLNNILGVSKLKGIKTLDTITKYNAVLKAWILQTSLFHHMAFGRSYYLGTNRKTFKEMNAIDAVNDGNRMIDELNPVIVQGVRNGLTLGRKQDWQEELLKEKTAIGKVLDQTPVTRVVKDKILKLRETQADFLFGVVGAGLKAKAFAIEYRNQVKKYPNQDTDVIAKRVANLINDDFGGLHLQRMGRNPTVQHIFRLIALAPDWTESNIRTMVKSFNAGGKEETRMYRDFWAGIFAKGLTATVLANLALSAFDEDDENGKGTLERFYRNYKRAGAEGKYRWLDVDITPIYKAFGGTSKDRYYFSIIGHFKDPFKLTIRNDRAKKDQMRSTFKLGNTKAMQNKASIVSGIFLDYITGTDYAERRFTTLKELTGVDKEKGEYQTTRKGKYKKGDPKWGKLKGQTVTWDCTKRGSVETEQLPSFILNNVKGTQPVQVQQLMNYFAGEIDGFYAIMNSLGLGVSKTYGGDEIKDYTFGKYMKVPKADRMRKNGKYYIKETGRWTEINLKR